MTLKVLLAKKGKNFQTVEHETAQTRLISDFFIARNLAFLLQQICNKDLHIRPVQTGATGAFTGQTLAIAARTLPTCWTTAVLPARTKVTIALLAFIMTTSSLASLNQYCPFHCQDSPYSIH